MSTFSQLRKRYVRLGDQWGIALATGFSLSLAGCAGSAELRAGPNVVAFKQLLASKPPVCARYRELYVLGFSQNVAGLSSVDDRLTDEAREIFEQGRQLLQSEGLSPSECARPYCVIEPLEGGKLDKWCGYRLDADSGTELY